MTETNNNYFLQFKGKPAVWSLSFMARPVYAFLDDIVDGFVILKLSDGRPFVAAVRTVEGVGLPRDQKIDR